jgi:hypothetical protein
VADALKAQGLPYVFPTGYGIAGLIPAYRCRPVLQKPFLLSELRKAMLESLMEHLAVGWATACPLPTQSRNMVGTLRFAPPYLPLLKRRG